jgi:medium-chain acyl-[acyl-carrier-protein] hydrolase
MTPTSRWLIRRHAAHARLRLFCLPFAGGNASVYAPWQAELGPDIEVCAVQLPGRASRLSELPLTSLPELIETLANIVAREAGLPFAFFGHSMGALLGFEVARHCARHGLPTPVRLFASGCAAPQRRAEKEPVHCLPDDELIAELGTYNGTPPELLAHRELMALVLPMLRADFGLVENYVYRPGPLLNIPVTVLAGVDDPHVERAQAEAWSLESNARCDLEWFNGDHFFIQQETAQVLGCVRRYLASHIAHKHVHA